MDASPDLEERRAELRRIARRFQGAPRQPDWIEIDRVAQWCRDNDVVADSYGDGDGLQDFEARVAEMLGYPAARYMPSGTMAQQIALRIWADRSGVKAIGMHPTCHLELHEERGYEHLHRLSRVFVGDMDRPMLPPDLAAISGPLSALVVELPTRENGGQLAPWDDLVSLTEQARGRGISAHLDGARLWEAAVGYGRSLRQICELFDSTYVSFYKGIGALPGSMLLGSEDFIADAIVWQRRHGGNLYTQMANWVSAATRLDDQLAAMPAHLRRAREIAAVISAIDGLEIKPPEPHVSMFHVHVDGDQGTILAARDRAAVEYDLWLFGELAPTAVERRFGFEISIGDAALDIETDEIVAAFELLTSATE